jgi:hypothetical protein
MFSLIETKYWKRVIFVAMLAIFTFISLNEEVES